MDKSILRRLGNSLPHNIEEGGDALKLTPWTNRQMVPAHAITYTQNTNDGTYENTQIQMCHCGLLWMMQIVDPMHHAWLFCPRGHFWTPIYQHNDDGDDDGGDDADDDGGDDSDDDGGDDSDVPQDDIWGDIL